MFEFFLGLNVFLVSQVSLKFGINHSLKLLTNLILHFLKCVNLVFLTIFCYVYPMFQVHFMVVFELFTLFNTFSLQC